MNEKLKGLIVFMPIQEFSDYTHTEENLSNYYSQIVEGVIIINDPGEQFQRIAFDVIHSEDYLSGYVKGFIYTNGKFLGHFHYLADANLPKESIKGQYKKVESGFEIKGVFKEGASDNYGFYLNIGYNHSNNEVSIDKPIVTIPVVEKIPTTPKRKVNKKIDTLKNVLHEENLRIITVKSEIIRKKKGRKGYNLYQHTSDWNFTPSKTDDLVIGISIAYSWMPTMLDLYIEDKNELEGLLILVQELGKIKSLQNIYNNETEIENWLVSLSSAINNSIVGTSKVLHIFFNKTIPIIDTNALKGWNKMFKKYFKRYPELKIPVNIPTDPNRRVRIYIKYWKLMMMLKANTKSKSIRQVEEPFYWFGMK